MIEIQVPETIKIGGFDYVIEVSPERDKALYDGDCRGEHSERMRRIAVYSTLAPQEFSAVTIHEFIHAVNVIYCNRKIDEELTQVLTNGLLQVMEQLGVRFVKRA